MVRIGAFAARLALLLVVLLVVLAACGGSASPLPIGSGAGNPLLPVPTAPRSATPAPTPGATTTSTPRATPTPRPTPTPFVEYQAAEDLKVGDCYDPINDHEDETLLAAAIRECDEPHLHEVFGLVLLSDPLGSPYPADRDIEDASLELCDAAFERYVGIALDDSDYGYLYYTPTDITWANGDRLVMCVVDDNDRPITGSLKGTGS
jgi:hypothetical protein